MKLFFKNKNAPVQSALYLSTSLIAASMSVVTSEANESDTSLYQSWSETKANIKQETGLDYNILGFHATDALGDELSVSEGGAS
ncbi:hypothetical protein ACT0HV_000591 [Vibrio diabolicus]